MSSPIFNQLIISFRSRICNKLRSPLLALLCLGLCVALLSIITTNHHRSNGEFSISSSLIIRPAGSEEWRESFARYVEGFDISINDKEFNGHTLNQHIGKKQDDLIGRLNEVLTLRASSSFADVDIANKVIRMVLKDNEKEITHWLHNRGDKKSVRLQESFDFQTGITMRRGEKSIIEADSVVVVLKRTGDAGFFVLTAFPEINEGDDRHR